MSETLALYLRELKLPTILEQAQAQAIVAAREGWTPMQYLNHLAEMEVQDRRQRRMDRWRRESALPSSKSRSTLELDKLPDSVRTQLPMLCEGQFVEQAHNILAFGLPGRGKTHVLCAIGHELIRHGYRVLFMPAYQLVQRLLEAKQQLRLERLLRRLDLYAAVIIDDIGYIQQNRDEMEVLFTFLAERYERKSVMISSNLVFSQWDRIFKDPMTTAAAIDRLVHHAIILEMTGPSHRTEAAKSKQIQQRESAKKEREST
jgi:DNA replication protein DnaC